MKTYAVYDEETGTLVSTGTVLDKRDLPQGLGVYEFDSSSGNLDARHEWDSDTRTVGEVTLVASSASIPADGQTASTVTYSDTRASAPESVVFIVNGVSSSQISLSSAGNAFLDVTSTTPDDIITVECNGLTLQIGTH